MCNHIDSRPIVIMGPMDCEISDIIKKIATPKEVWHGGYKFVEGYIDDYPVVAVRTLIGMVNVSASTTIAITEYNPLCIIIQGTSGAHDIDLHRGDIILGENIIEHGSYYTFSRKEGEGWDNTKRDYPGAEVYINNSYERIKVFHSDDNLLKIALAVPYSYGKVSMGTISSADIWNKEADMINHLHNVRGSDCEEMENFAVAQVCFNFNIPCLGIRIISNNELHPSEPFDDKYGIYCQEFTMNVVKNIIKNIS